MTVLYAFFYHPESQRCIPTSHREKNSIEQSMLGNKQEETSYKQTTQDIKKRGFVNREMYAKWMPCGIYVNNLSRMVLFWNLLFTNKHHKQHFFKRCINLQTSHDMEKHNWPRQEYITSAEARVSVVYLSSVCQWHYSPFTSIRESALLKHHSPPQAEEKEKYPPTLLESKKKRKCFTNVKLTYYNALLWYPMSLSTIEESGSRRRSIFIERVKDPWFTSHGEYFSLRGIFLKSPVERERENWRGWVREEKSHDLSRKNKPRRDTMLFY